MHEFGNQYPNDDKTDPTGFLKKARFHQSKFRAEILQLPFDTLGNYLIKEDAEIGKNFFPGFQIFEAVKKRYKTYSKPLYANMLRSEHIPFNLLIPFNSNKTYFKEVLSEFFSDTIHSIDRIEIEYAPTPKQNYLDDGTSFDAYIEYTHFDNSKGIIGIEVKYTEKEYKLLPKSKQEKEILNESSRYYAVNKRSNLFKDDPKNIELLRSDKFRQVWRNHLLGESILQTELTEFKHFTSLTLFPKGNQHFIQTSKDYVELLRVNKNNFIALTFEDFLIACEKYCPDIEFMTWLNYLKDRYILAN
jgi:hypothetical protein